MKHIYVNTSDYDILPELSSDPNFQHPSSYSMRGYANLSEREYGCIFLENICVHFIIGKIPQDNCPWCDSPVCMEKKPSDENYLGPMGANRYFMKCHSCGSRGPIMNVQPKASENKEALEHILDMLRSRYRIRTPWDKNLKNPYDL